MVEVLKAGFYDSIQDIGRVGYQQYGVPYSGIMDVYAATLANSLLGNEVNEAVMEMTMTGPSLRFQCDTFICVSGADMCPSLNGKSIRMNCVEQISKGEILNFGKLNNGFRSYLAVKGGFQTETIFKSKSMYPGITKKFKIRNGDSLSIKKISNVLNKQYASIKWNDTYLKTKTINVFKGPEFNQLSEIQSAQLFLNDFTISKNNSRMAYQLEGVFYNELDPILTSLVLPGTVQLTPAGNLIILMRDCQTTGGYPRILQLEESSIDTLAQKYMGQKIKFQLITYK
jgi:biotin-dependent carboxylase-like uncharacterized protein